jgi:hypothetical protein
MGQDRENLPAEKEQPKKADAKMFSLSFVLKVAASVIVVMGVCFALYLRNTDKRGVEMADINPAYAKQQVHYASLVESKRTELKELAKSDPQLYKEFSKEITKMDSVYLKLKSDLANSPNPGISFARNDPEPANANRSFKSAIKRYRTV